MKHRFKLTRTPSGTMRTMRRKKRRHIIPELHEADMKMMHTELLKESLDTKEQPRNKLNHRRTSQRLRRSLVKRNLLSISQDMKLMSPKIYLTKDQFQ